MLAGQQLGLIGALLLVGWAHSALWLLVGMLLVGLLGTAMTQGLIAYAAAAAPQERGRVVGAAQGGVVLGLLLARTLSGALADIGGWRTVYFFSAGVTLVLLPILSRLLPAPRTAPSTLSYPALLRSMLSLLLHDRTLQIRGMLALLMFGAFSLFWSSLVLPLSGRRSTSAMPQWGVRPGRRGGRAGGGARRASGGSRAGAGGQRRVSAAVDAGTVAARFDRQRPGLAGGGHRAAGSGGPAIHVLNQSMIFSAHPQSHSRLVGCYMLFYAVGSGLGARAGTHMYARRAGAASAGWGGRQPERVAVLAADAARDAALSDGGGAVKAGSPAHRTAAEAR